MLDEPTSAVLRRAVTASGWGDGVDVLAGAEQTDRHDRPDPGAAQLTRLRRALDRLEGMAPGRTDDADDADDADDGRTDASAVDDRDDDRNDDRDDDRHDDRHDAAAADPGWAGRTGW